MESSLSWGLNRACYDKDTLVLTENGWKLHNAVKLQERIMVYDPVTNSMWYEVPGQLLAFEYDGQMVRFRSTLVDILVTPNHRMLYKSSSRNLDKLPWKIGLAKDLVGKRVNLPGTAYWEGGEDIEYVEVPEFWNKNGSIGPTLLHEVRIRIATWLRLAGYYLSEGGMDTTNRYLFTLSQAKRHKEVVDEIRSTLACLPFHSFEYLDEDEGSIRWNVYGKQLCEFVVSCFGEGSTAKFISAKFKNLPPRHLKSLLQPMLKGDGTKKAERFIRLTTTSKQLAYDVAEIAAKIGLSTNIRTAYEAHGNRSTCYSVSFPLARYRGLQKSGITTPYYKGPVYCFSVSTGFYVTMRNGKIAFQGNTFIAAAKRGFKGGSGSGTGGKESERSSKPKNAYFLGGGDEMAFKIEKGGVLLFTFGGKVQTEEEFDKRIRKRFGDKFPEAWNEALAYVKKFDKNTLLSAEDFFRDVYRPVRDVWAEKWSAASDQA
ncbi:MAG TPA: LAGLIDADG family homing endonuclease [Nitrososphaerales archaeon]|nr:LAGLIDADG family homing endonuclease [Nitrososphaerales archaeon]